MLKKCWEKREKKLKWKSWAWQMSQGKVFVYQGFMIGLFGTILGLGVGYVICVLQKKYGFISMGMESALVDAYPIRVQWLDFVVVGLAVFLITLALGYKPALEASKQNLDEI